MRRGRATRRCMRRCSEAISISWRRSWPGARTRTPHRERDAVELLQQGLGVERDGTRRLDPAVAGRALRRRADHAGAGGRGRGSEVHEGRRHDDFDRLDRGQLRIWYRRSEGTLSRARRHEPTPEENERVTTGKPRPPSSWEPDVNAANQAGETALHVAATQAVDSVAQLLVENGANIEAANKRGLTPLGVAIAPRPRNPLQSTAPIAGGARHRRCGSSAEGARPGVAETADAADAGVWSARPTAGPGPAPRAGPAGAAPVQRPQARKGNSEKPPRKHETIEHESTKTRKDENTYVWVSCFRVFVACFFVFRGCVAVP